ncbi:polymer-forming cytoskeletal protein [uncultured Psychroserpens sp.]|uniref:bactofilin family protein n=1 Tax=uncultured Psychroserpens sp. TaxID=255436 RepID=UPI00345C7596
MATDTISQQNTIAKGTTITGDIISDGDFRIEGTLQGNIKTPGKVVIGKSGVINGTLKSTNADIEGKFSGKLMISDVLSLRSTAHVEGEAEVGKLAVEIDATFNATCVMKGALKELNNGPRTGQQTSIQRPTQTGSNPEKGQSA